MDGTRNDRLSWAQPAVKTSLPHMEFGADMGILQI